MHLKNRYSFSIELLSPLPSLVAQRVKCLPAMWETGFESGVRKAPLEIPLGQDAGLGAAAAPYGASGLVCRHRWGPGWGLC